MESKAFVKSIVVIHILILHSWHFCSIILNVAKWSVVWYDLLNPPGSSACSWSNRGYNLPYRIVENNFYNAGYEQIGRVVTYICHVTLCNTFIFTFFQASSDSFCFYDFVEDLSHHFFRFFVTFFDAFGADSVVVCRYAFIESVDYNL